MCNQKNISAIKIALISIFFVLKLCLPAIATQGSRYEGRYFLIGFMQNDIDPRNLIQKIYIAASTPTQVTINTPFDGTKTRTIFMGANSVAEFVVSRNAEVTGSEMVINNALTEIYSNSPIAVYAFSSQTTSSDGYSAIPATLWGNEYYVSSYPDDYYLNDAVCHNGEFMVIARDDSTSITYIPTASTIKNNQAGVPRTIMLQHNQCYLVQSAKGLIGTNDISGTHIIASKPVGLLVGHLRAGIPINLNASSLNSKDHLLEMLAPVATWGTTYASSPFGTHWQGDLFRIFAKDSNTVLTVNRSTGTQIVQMPQPGGFSEFPSETKPILWKANKPIQVVQYMRTADAFVSTVGDPSIVTLAPVDQFVNHILFRTPGTDSATQFLYHYINVVCDSVAYNSLTIAGPKGFITVPPAINGQMIPGTSLHWAKIDIPEGGPYLLTAAGNFSGVIFGVGGYDSYAIPLGSSLADSLPIDNIPPFFLATYDSCANISGIVHDTGSIKGLLRIWVDDTQTQNYSVFIPTFTTGSSSATFFANVINPLNSAQLTVRAMDRSGNVASFQYFYTPPKLVYSADAIDFGQVTMLDSVCRPYSIFNSDSKPIVLQQISFVGDTRMHLKNPPALPDTIQPGTFISFDICFISTKDSSAMNVDLRLQFNCNIGKKILLKATVGFPSFYVNAENFDPIRVGETSCLHGIVRKIIIKNTGLKTIHVDSIRFVPSTKYFWLQSKGILPADIASGGIIEIPVCFSPDSVGIFTVKAIVQDNKYGLIDSVTISGEGIAPFVHIADINWMRRRVGTINDTTFLMWNSGNDRTAIRVQSFTGDTAVLSQKILDNSPIFAGDTLHYPYNFHAVFAPVTRKNYSAKLELKTDWNLHPQISGELRGIGTLPEMHTRDIDFGALHFATTKDTTTDVIFSTGNERLTIDRIRFISGDSAAFIINPVWFATSGLDTATNLFIAVRFAPVEVRDYNAVIEVIHDAKPNFLRDTAFIRLHGAMIHPDTVRAILDASMIDFGFACEHVPLDFSITNTGNIAINIDTIIVNSKNAEIIWISPSFPLKLDLAKPINIRLSTKPLTEGLMSVTITVKFGDSVLSITKTLFASLSKISIDNIPASSAYPGDTLTLKFSGEMTGADSLDLRFSMRALYPFTSLMPINSQTTIRFTDKSGEKSLPAQISQDFHGALIQTDKSEMFFLPAHWQMELPVKIFLDTIAEPNISLQLAGNDCALGATAIVPIKIDPVCANSLRPIRLMSVFSLFASPNPVENEANVEFELPDDDTVTLSLFNALGQRFLQFEKLSLKKGKHSYKLQCSKFESGVYALFLQANNKNQQYYFIIKK